MLLSPFLATSIGLNEAIVLQQLHYWIQNKQKAQKSYFDGRFWVYNTYEQWQKQFPFWSISTIRRTIYRLEKQNLILSRNYNRAGFDKTKWYSINYEALNQRISKIVFTSDQDEQTICSNRADTYSQFDQANTIDYTETSKPDILEMYKGSELQTSSHQAPFDWQSLEKQIEETCAGLKIDNCNPYIMIIEYYFTVYRQVLHKEHPRLSMKAMNAVICAIRDGCEMLQDNPLDVEAYKEMIPRHFQTKYQGCDYHICHFMTEGIRNNRFYETCY